MRGVRRCKGAEVWRHGGAEGTEVQVGVVVVGVVVVVGGVRTGRRGAGSGRRGATCVFR